MRIDPSDKRPYVGSLADRGEQEAVDKWNDYIRTKRLEKRNGKHKKKNKLSIKPLAIQLEKDYGSIELLKIGLGIINHILVDKNICSEKRLRKEFIKEYNLRYIKYNTPKRK